MALTYIPRPLNMPGIQLGLTKSRCQLWYDPGLGKTGMVLYVLSSLWVAGSNQFPVLVLGTKRVARRVWRDECKKWAHLQDFNAVSLVGDKKHREEMLELALAGGAHIVSINYENIEWLVDRLKNQPWPFPAVVADESTKLKSFRLRRGSKRAAALAKIAKFTGRWFNLTGTPLPQNYADIWGQMWFIDQGMRLGHSFSKFTDRWFTYNEYSRTYVPKKGACDEIAKRIADVTVSVRARDWLDLPLDTKIYLPVDLPPDARKHYKSMEQEYFAEIHKEVVDAKSAGDKRLKCLQIASGALWVGEGEDRKWVMVHDEKVEALRDLIEELQGDPLLVVYYFKHDLERLQKAFPKGRLIKTEKDEDDWNAGKIKVGFAHPDSIGHGINLQDGGNKYCFFSHWWALESYLQVLERMGAVRQLQAGHNRGCILYFIVARDTVDEDVIKRRDGKETRMDKLRKRVMAERQRQEEAGEYSLVD